MMDNNTRYTVFLDRDGVINKDSKDYIKTPAEFEFLPQSPEAVALLTKNKFRVILITNQSVINRKMATQQTLDAIFEKLKQGVQEAGGRVDDIFFCPHAPDEGCDCRKPKPGMIHLACKKYRLNLSDTCMVGDSVKDIECAQNAGCAKTILVKTGNGQKAALLLKKKLIFPDYIAQNLYDAALWLIKQVNTTDDNH